MEDRRQRSPGHTVSRGKHKTDLFAVFVLALTVGAIGSQAGLVLWLSSR